MLILFFLATGIFLNYKFSPTIDRVDAIYDELKKVKNFNLIQVNSGRRNIMIYGGIKNISYLYVKVNLKSKAKNKEEKDEIMNFIAKKIFAVYPEALKKYIITVELTRGYDIFIASNWKRYKLSLSPDLWKQMLEE